MAEIPRGSAERDERLARLGAVVEMLRGPPVFRLFRLTPHSGRFVRGFGQAYRVTGDT